MMDRSRIAIRLAIALVAGALVDLFGLRDAFAYNDRDWLGSHALTLFWLTLAFVTVVAFVLNLTGGDSSADPGTPRAWHRSLDAHGLLIPFAILLGATVARTVVLVRELIIDPTSHNLLPFEYLIAWIVVGIPALIGSMSARAGSWLLNRMRAQ
jgi:hypothetical protein